MRPLEMQKRKITAVLVGIWIAVFLVVAIDDCLLCKQLAESRLSSVNFYALNHPWNITPIPVYIQSSTTPLNDSSSHTVKARDGLLWWEDEQNRISGDVGFNASFREVAEPPDHGIIVNWVDVVKNDSSILGRTQCLDERGVFPCGEGDAPRCNRELIRCILEIKKSNDSQQTFYNVRHEAGHALGRFFHSTNRSHPLYSMGYVADVNIQSNNYRIPLIGVLLVLLLPYVLIAVRRISGPPSRPP